jgi:hypothetical protein
MWDKISMKIAWLLPKRVVMWASVRLMAYATHGKYGNECPDAVNIMTALKRWPV